MADDPTDEEFDEEDIEVDLDDEELGDDIDGELGDDVLVDGDDVEEVDEDDEAAADAALAARPKREDDDDDDDDINPDDVEADLDEILKDRIAAADEDEEDEEEIVPEPRTSVEIAEGVTPKKANEFMCTGCFLLVNRGQFGVPGAMHCPVGEAECPAIAMIESGALDAPATSRTKKTTATKTPAKKTAKKSAATSGGTKKKSRS